MDTILGLPLFGALLCLILLFGLLKFGYGRSQSLASRMGIRPGAPRFNLLAVDREEFRLRGHKLVDMGYRKVRMILDGDNG